MKKQVLFLLIASLLLIVPNAGAVPLTDGMQVYLEDAGGTTNGGPFNVYSSDTDELLFTSFCLEYTEYIYLGSTHSYYAYFDAYADAGGGKDYLGSNTAWVYETWLSGNNYGWNDDDVQYAIWYLEGEKALASLSATARDIVTAAVGNTGSAQVMNLYSYSDKTGPAQSQIAPVPEPATMLLLGTGLIGLAGLSRKKFRS